MGRISRRRPGRSCRSPRGTSRALASRMPDLSILASSRRPLVALAIAAAVALFGASFGARSLGAQAAGVIEPPPVRAPAPPPAPVAAGPTVNAAARRDSLSLRQRLDIQAWVDSAAGALARGAPATTVPLTPPPPAPTTAPTDTARPAPARPAPRRPVASEARPARPARPARVARATWAVAARGSAW